MLKDQRSGYNKYLTIEQHADAGYVWKVDGQFRTVTFDIPMDSEGSDLELDKQYSIVNRDGKSFEGNCVGECVEKCREILLF